MTLTSSELKVRLYKSLLRLRRIEEVLADEYRKGTMRTPTHFGIGQEAVAVGACQALEPEDVVYTHHRSHTHYLAKGGSLFGLMAELLGREGGCSRGRGGSVHLIDRAAGFLGSSPILGHSLALATGSALAYQMRGQRNVAVAFFGEGAFDEGAVWESINFAAIRKLPVLFVCENNLYATESPLSVRQAEGTDTCAKVRSFKVEAERLDGNDVGGVHRAAVAAAAKCRAGGGPVLLECMTYRWREHVGPLWDYEANRTYRSREELDAWMEKCPVQRAGIDLVGSGMATPDALQTWLAEIEKEIADTLKLAYESPWPDVSSLFDNVY
jgi:pyruvate dehydrogenase E1 component alpha subunit